MSERPVDEPPHAAGPFVWLDDPAATAVERVGAKFVSLAALRRELTEIGGAYVPDAVALPVGVTDRLGPAELRAALDVALRRLVDGDGDGSRDDVHGGATLLAVRSSATEEDGDVASHAGVYDSYLGLHDAHGVHDAVRRVLESARGPRARAYRADAAGDHGADMAVIVQRQVRADLGGWSGVVFTHDPETGAAEVLIEAVDGPGAPLVGGTVDPLRWRDSGGGPVRVDRTDRTDLSGGPPGAVLAELVRIARALAVRRGRALDVEWSIDGPDGSLALVQARPLWLATEPSTAGAHVRAGVRATPGVGSEPIVRGLAVGRGAVTGTALVVADPEDVDDLEPGTVLVVAHTDPSWMPLLAQASALVTDHGGLTSHAAIVARELGVLAVLGCGDATEQLAARPSPPIVTVHCGDDGIGVVTPA